MTSDWVYLVNDKSDNWGYRRADGTRVPVLDFFLGEARSQSRTHLWTLSRNLSDFSEDDTIWVRAALPLGAFIGAGRVKSEPEKNDGEGVWGFKVQWDDDLSRRMAMDPISGVLEKHTQQTRKLLPSELQTLRSIIGEPAPSLAAESDSRDLSRRLRRVLDRQGQPQFRARLLEAYDRRCAISGTGVEAVLQAAHITTYALSGENATQNGLLLRADLHDLFDRGCLWVTANGRIGISEELVDTEYAQFKGKKLRVPQKVEARPSQERLDKHRREVAGRLS